MRFIKYLTDNPFRLLGIATTTVCTEMRIVANKAHQGLKVGIKPEAEEVNLFGDDELTRCTEIVRSLASDPTERVVYRILWTNKAQGNFLSSWIKFLEIPSSIAAKQTISTLQNHLSGTRFDFTHVELLKREGETQDISIKAVSDAKLKVTWLVLDSIAQQSVYYMEHQAMVPALALTDVIRDSSLDESTRHNALALIINFGEREAKRIQEEKNNFDGWTPEQTAYDALETASLKMLCEHLTSVTPSVPLWLELIKGRISQVAYSMRSYAIDLANDQDEYQESLRIINLIKALPLDVELVAKIRDDEDALHNIIKQASKNGKIDQQKSYNDKERSSKATKNVLLQDQLEPIESAPSLYTLNGIGTTLYEGSSFPGIKDWKLATHFFCIFFIPVFPIDRYAVSKAPTGGWYFHAKVPLSIFSLWYRRVILTLVPLFFLYFIVLSLNDPVKSTTLPQYSDPPKPSVPPYSPSPERDASISSTETIPASPQAPEEIDETPGSKSPITIDENPTEKARKKLQKEFDVLDADVKLRKKEMETRRETLRQLTEKINISSTLLDNTDHLAVEVHNRLVSDYNDLRGEFNLDINTLNEDVQRLNKMAHKINRMGEQKYGNN